MIDDAELLRRYVESRSEAAFAAFVARHLGLAYFAALRRVNGNAALAEEVAQYVFTTAAREAAELMRHATVTGWLYTTTRNAAAKAVRAETVRQRHAEGVALHLMQTHATEPAADWERLRPAIDESLEALHAREREAVLLRFFEGRAFAEIGAALKISEDAARMRVERALEKLRGQLQRHGVTSTSGALTIALTTQAGAAVPVGLAGSVTSGALTGAAVAGATGFIAGATAFMSMTKFGFGVAGVAVLAGALGLAVSERRARWAAEASVAMASREYDLALGRLRDVEQRAQATQQNGVRAEQVDNSSNARPLASAVAIAAETEAVNELVRSNAKAAGDLLMARHPEVKQAFLDWGAAVVNADSLPLYRVLNLSPAQIEQFQVLHRGQSPLHTETHMETESTAGKINDVVEAIELSVPRLERREVEARLRELLGAEGYRIYWEYQRMRGAREHAVLLAEALCFSAAPLTADQATQIVRVMDQHSTRETTRLPKFDWNAVGTAAKGILTSEQLPALSVVRAEDRYRQALHQAPEPSGGPKP